MRLWAFKRENRFSIWHAARTALAATLAIFVARLLGMPEAHWAAIGTLLVLQSTLRATLTSSIVRIVATALGALVGAMEATYFGDNLVAFAIGLFLLGLLSLALPMGKNAYRYAGVTLAIVVLIPRVNAAWIIAAHRFIEISLGILVALAVVAVWREEPRLPGSA